jgi:hypothetical protein
MSKEKAVVKEGLPFPRLEQTLRDANQYLIGVHFRLGPADLPTVAIYALRWTAVLAMALSGSRLHKTLASDILFV